MAFNGINKSPNEGGNVWSAGSRGSRGGVMRSDNDDNNGGRGGGSYRNNYARRANGGGYGFRRNENEDIEILKDAIFIQNLPTNITRDDIQEAFSTVGPIKMDDRSGGPKIWIYKDRMTGEGNGRATVTYEDEETASKAISEYNDQHIDSISAVVRVQLAQRRARNSDNNNRGGFQNNRGFRGGRGNWNNNNQSRPGFNSAGGNRWNNSRGGGFRGRGSGDQGGGIGSYRGSRGNSYRGTSHGGDNSPNY